MLKRIVLFVLLACGNLHAQNYIDDYPKAEMIKDTLIFIVDYDTTGPTRYTRKVYWVDLKNDVGAAASDSDFVKITADTATISNVDTDLTFYDGVSNSPLIRLAPASGPTWEIFTQDSDDDLQIFVNSASTRSVDIVNAAGAVANLTVEGDLFEQINLEVPNETSSLDFFDKTLAGDLIVISNTDTIAWFMDSNDYVQLRNFRADSIDGARTDSLYIKQRVGIGAQPDALSTLYVYNQALAGPLFRLESEQNSTIGPQQSLFLNTTSPADGDAPGLLLFQSKSDAGAIVGYATISAKINDPSDGAEDGVLLLSVVKNGTENTVILRLDSLGTTFETGGVVVGSPTGGNKGDGTINATAVYDDNVQLSDYVFQLEYKKQMLTIKQMARFAEKHKHLPTIDGKKTWEKQGKPPVGKLLSQIYETVEVQALYIAELERRIAQLEARQ